VIVLPAIDTPNKPHDFANSYTLTGEIRLDFSTHPGTFYDPKGIKSVGYDR